MKWRLGIDLGTNSLGWAVLEVHEWDQEFVPVRLVDCGSRIFSDARNPKDKQSNAAKRREPRGARKNRDRGKRRDARLMRQLIGFGLMPVDLAARKALEGGKGVPLNDSDPWILRARGLREALSAGQFGRALYHLNQRRGFKSNRKTDRADSESGKVYDAIKRTNELLDAAGAKTLGDFFGKQRLAAFEHNKTARKGDRVAQPLARVRKSGDGAKWGYDYYPTRDLVLNEFDQLWAAQRAWHGDMLTEDARVTLRDTIEWQHPLKSPPVGKCTLMPEESRAPRALPSSQRARIFQEVNALRVMPAGQAARPLTLEERDIIADRLLTPTSKTGRVTFNQIRKLKGLSIYDSFNTETEKRKDLAGDETAARLMQADRWGPEWLDLDPVTQDEIVDRLLNDEDKAKLVTWLCQTHGFDEDQATRVADCLLPQSYGSLSKTALNRILPALEADVTVYSDAVIAAGFSSHSQFGTGEIFDTGLPYYGLILERSTAFGTGDPKDCDEVRYGKVANPTVHVALNQIRVVVNDLIKRFGPPAQIVLELARGLPLSAKGKAEEETRQKKNQLENERRNAMLREWGEAENYENRMRLRLWEELGALDRRCVFTGHPISKTNLFTAEVEIEHILPFSRTLDDSFSNKTLCMRQANRDKGNKTPYEAFGHSPVGYDWVEIAKRSAELSPGKRWRFGPDAMARYEAEEGGFLKRQLTDTQYISRLAKGYLEAIYGGQGHAGGKNNVWVITGRLTADLRWRWGLDSVLHGHNSPDAADAKKKNRNDHRHHAIDAVVIGCTDRKMLKQAAEQAKHNEEKFSDRLLADIEAPWDNFRDEVADQVRNMIVSHKPDHGYQDAMHNDTAYGILAGQGTEPDKENMPNVVTRKPLDSDAFKAPKDVQKILDYQIKIQLLEATQGLAGKDFKEVLLKAAHAMKPPVYKVRMGERLKVIPITDQTGKAYKAYKGDGNYCYDIWRNEKGKWVGEVISTYDAYQMGRADENWWCKPIGRNGQPLIMRIRKGDMLQIVHDGRQMIVQVAKFTPGKFALAEHFEANVDARTRDTASGLKYIFKSPGSLQTSKANRATISPSGIVKIYD